MSGKQGIHKQHLFAGLRVGLYHWVSNRRVGGNGICEALPAAGFRETLFEAMTEVVHGNQPVKIALHPGREPLVGCGHACKQGIATHFRNRYAAQHRDRWWVLPERHVGVPHLDFGRALSGALEDHDLW